MCIRDSGTLPPRHCTLSARQSKHDMRRGTLPPRHCTLPVRQSKRDMRLGKLPPRHCTLSERQSKRDLRRGKFPLRQGMPSERQRKRDMRRGTLPPRHCMPSERHLKQAKGLSCLQKDREKQQEARSGHVVPAGKQRSGASSEDWAGCRLHPALPTAPAGLCNINLQVEA